MELPAIQGVMDICTKKYSQVIYETGIKNHLFNLDCCIRVYFIFDRSIRVYSYSRTSTIVLQVSAMVTVLLECIVRQSFY